MLIVVREGETLGWAQTFAVETLYTGAELYLIPQLIMRHEAILEYATAPGGMLALFKGAHLQHNEDLIGGCAPVLGDLLLFTHAESAFGGMVFIHLPEGTKAPRLGFLVKTAADMVRKHFPDAA